MKLLLSLKNALSTPHKCQFYGRARTATNDEHSPNVPNLLLLQYFPVVHYPLVQGIHLAARQQSYFPKTEYRLSAWKDRARAPHDSPK